MIKNETCFYQNIWNSSLFIIGFRDNNVISDLFNQQHYYLNKRKI